MTTAAVLRCGPSGHCLVGLADIEDTAFHLSRGSRIFRCQCSHRSPGGAAAGTFPHRPAQDCRTAGSGTNRASAAAQAIPRKTRARPTSTPTPCSVKWNGQTIFSNGRPGQWSISASSRWKRLPSKLSVWRPICLTGGLRKIWKRNGSSIGVSIGNEGASAQLGEIMATTRSFVGVHYICRLTRIQRRTQAVRRSARVLLHAFDVPRYLRTRPRSGRAGS